MMRKLGAGVVILGGGLAGLSAMWHLKDQDCLLLEKDDRVGGLACTDVVESFRFDRGSHVWFTSIDLATVFIEDLGLRMQAHERSAWVHICDSLVPAPFQANLYGLPKQVISDCLVGYVDAVQNGNRSDRSFADWLRGTFGEGIYWHFMQPYNMKVWTVPPEELATDWQGARVDVPKLDELIDGAIGLKTNALGANARFAYPEKGGIEAIVSAMARGCPNVMCNAQVTQIDLVSKSIDLVDGTIVQYDRLVSTIPLPSLARLLRGSDACLDEAAKSLRSTQVLLVNIALKSRPDHDYHWIYFAEPKYPFFRVSFPHNYSSTMCPGDTGSIQAECAFPSDGYIDSAEIAEAVKRRLAQAGYLDPAQVLFVNTKLLNPAYVLCDHNRRANLKLIFDHLSRHDVYSCGRFGAWDYLNMDDCVVAGMTGKNWTISKSGDNRAVEQSILVDAGQDCGKFPLP